MTREPTEMETKVAEAIKSAGGLGTTYLSLARAAIRAMREPTTEMKDVGHPEDGPLHPYFAWQSMIDVASPPEEK